MEIEKINPKENDENVGIRKGLHKKSIEETLKILQEMWR